MRSRTGCQTCRDRKLKCDEVKPICGQCQKGPRECVYSNGLLFRHQQNASMNGVEEENGAGQLGAYFAYKNTFSEGDIWVPVPKNVTFLNITNPYEMEERSPIERESELGTAQMGRLEALSAIAAGSFPAQPPRSPDDLAPVHSNDISFILNPAGSVNSTSGLPRGIMERSEAPAAVGPSPLLRPSMDVESTLATGYDFLSIVRNISVDDASDEAKEVFWNFARQDFFKAFISEGSTELNTDDLALWRAAGLTLDEQGFVSPSTTYPVIKRRDMMYNTMVWLASKIVNYTVSGDSVDHVFPQDRTSPTGLIGINQMMLLERWKELEKELSVWYREMLATFRLNCILPWDLFEALGSSVLKLYYDQPEIATTMQLYHMASIILLINRPQESTARRTTLFTRLHSYRTILQEVGHHSKAIIEISTVNTEPSVRINSIQPLFVAGQCFTEVRDCRITVDLLKGIEADLGAATDYRVKQLLNDWGWEDHV